MTDGYRHYAGLHGSNIKTVGADENIYQYTNLETCLAAAQANDVIIIDQGTYSLTATNTINHSITMVGRGRVIVNGGAAGIALGLICLNKPAAGTAVTYMKFENIEFANAHATADVFMIDNDGGATGALDMTFLGCTIDAGVGAQAIDLDQTTETIHIYLRLIGRNGNTLNDCTFGLSYAASYVHIENYDMSAEATYFILDANDVASIYQFKNCIFSSAAITTTGAASILVSAIDCVNQTANVQRPLVDGDFDHTGVLTITGGSQAGRVKLIVAATGIPEFYNTLELAYAQAVAGDRIELEEGSHTVAASITLNKNITIVGKGRCIVTGGVAASVFIVDKPATLTTATYVTLDNLNIANTTDAADCVQIDNDGGGTGALYVNLLNCSFAVTGAGLAIDLDQTTATEHIYLYVKGSARKDKLMVTCNLALTLADSETYFEDVDFGAAVLVYGADNVASIHTLKNCIYESAAFNTGGAASVIFNYWNCVQRATGTITLPEAGDFDVTAASENIIPAS